MKMIILLAGVETLFVYTIVMMIYSLLTHSEESYDSEEELVDAGVKWGKFEGREDDVSRFINDAKATVFSESTLEDVVDVTTFIPIGSANAISSFNGRYTITGRKARVPTFEVFTVKDVKRSQDDPYPLESSLFIARVHGEDILATFGSWLYWSRHPTSLPVRASSRHYTHLTKVHIVTPVSESLPCPSDNEGEVDGVVEVSKKTLRHLSTKTLRSGNVY